MSEKLLRQQIHAAVDTRGKYMQPDPWLAQRVLRAAQEPQEAPHPVRKIRWAAVIALALMLAAAGAVAAVLLSLQQIVDDFAVPMAQESIGETNFTPDEVSRLVLLAEENGLVLSDYMHEQIAWAEHLGEGYPKDEFIKELAYSEFGSDMTRWTLGQQKWFDDALVAIGVFSENQKALPDNPEEASTLAVSRAIDHLTANFSISGDLADESQYAAGVQYINGDADGDYPGMYWSIDFRALTLTGGEYWVYLRDDGTILGEAVRPGLSEDSSASDVYDAFCNYYRKDYTSHVYWEQHVYQEFLAAARLVKPSNHQSYLCFIQTEYPDIPANAITIEEAFAIAAADLGVTDYRIFSYVLIGTETNPVWKFSLSRGDDRYSFELDCITGEIRTKRLLGFGDTKWWMKMVLWEVSDEVEANWVDDSPVFG